MTKRHRLSAACRTTNGEQNVNSTHGRIFHVVTQYLSKLDSKILQAATLLFIRNINFQGKPLFLQSSLAIFCHGSWEHHMKEILLSQGFKRLEENYWNHCLFFLGYNFVQYLPYAALTYSLPVSLCSCFAFYCCASNDFLDFAFVLHSQPIVSQVNFSTAGTYVLQGLHVLPQPSSYCHLLKTPSDIGRSFCIVLAFPFLL